MNVIYEKFNNFSIKEISDFLRKNYLYEKSQLSSRFRFISQNPNLEYLPNYHSSTKIVSNSFSGNQQLLKNIIQI